MTSSVLKTGEDASLNSGAPDSDLDEARAWVLHIQTKLVMESRMRGNAHVRFGGRSEETDWLKGQHRASLRPYSKSAAAGATCIGRSTAAVN